MKAMRRFGMILAAVAISLVAPAAQAQKRAAPERLVYFGTHGSSIYAARLNLRTGQLSNLHEAATVERPTWLVATDGPPSLYAVSETGNDGKSEARLYRFTVDPKRGALLPAGDAATGGGGSTHFILDERSRTAFLANYGSGSVSALALARDGSPAGLASIQKDFGTGPHRRQQSPHAHGVGLDPSGDYLLATDLGADRIFVYRFDRATRALKPATIPFVAAKAGSGPRHLLFHPNGRFVYANSELTGELTTYRWDARAGTLRPIDTRSTSAPDYAGDKSSAELAFSKDGRFLYLSNRGEDVIVAYAVDGRTGGLREVQRLPSGGKGPWSFGIDPGGKWLVVANEASSNVAVFAVDPRSGKLTPAGEPLAVPKPVAVAFIR